MHSKTQVVAHEKETQERQKHNLDEGQKGLQRQPRQKVGKDSIVIGCILAQKTGLSSGKTISVGNAVPNMATMLVITTAPNIDCVFTGSDMSLSPTRKKDETRQDAHKGS